MQIPCSNDFVIESNSCFGVLKHCEENKVEFLKSSLDVFVVRQIRFVSHMLIDLT